MVTISNKYAVTLGSNVSTDKLPNAEECKYRRRHWAHRYKGSLCILTISFYRAVGFNKPFCVLVVVDCCTAFVLLMLDAGAILRSVVRALQVA